MKRTPRIHIDDYPEILREQSLLGELSSELQKEIEASEGFAEFRTLRITENESILARHQVPVMTKQILERATIKKTVKLIHFPQFNRFILSAIPAAAALFVVFLLVQPFGTQSDSDGNRAKGNTNDTIRTASEVPILEIWKQTNNQAAPLTSGTTVKAFDSLQIAYRAMGRNFGVIISLDGNGKLTLHYPESFTASTVLQQGNAVVLPYAYQLDNAPRFERFIFITSNTEFKVAPVWALIEQQLGAKTTSTVQAMEAPLNLSPGFEVSSFLLRK